MVVPEAGYAQAPALEAVGLFEARQIQREAVGRVDLGVGLPLPPAVVVLGDGEDGFGPQPFGVGEGCVSAGAGEFAVAPVGGQVARGGGVVRLRDAPEFVAHRALEHGSSERVVLEPGRPEG